MIQTRTLALITLGVVLSTPSLHAQGRRPQYRGFHLGSDLQSVSALAKAMPGAAKTIHVRPAVIQELEWRPPYDTIQSSASADPVQQIVFSFYNDHLFKLVISYDRYRTDGLTDADLIEALSAAYGPPSPLPAKAPAPVSQFEEFRTAVAQWEEADYSVVLHRSAYVPAFRVTVTSPQLEALARTAIVQAIKLDEREAPQREIARQTQEAEKSRVAQEKARVANKPAFRP